MLETSPNRGGYLLVAAVSGRALAQAARRAGYRVRVADFFCDADTVQAAEGTALLPGDLHSGIDAARLIGVLDELALEEPPLAVILGSGFERLPDLVDKIAGRFKLAGVKGDAIRRVKDPERFAADCAELRIPHPAISRGSPADPENWLIKRAGAAGGSHVRLAGNVTAPYTPTPNPSPQGGGGHWDGFALRQSSMISQASDGSAIGPAAGAIGPDTSTLGPCPQGGGGPWDGLALRQSSMNSQASDESPSPLRGGVRGGGTDSIASTNIGMDGSRATESGAQADDDLYFQRYVEGESISVLFLAAEGKAHLVGFSRQWTSPSQTMPYRYGGAVRLSSFDLGQGEAIGNWLCALTRRTGLVGLCSADFIQASDGCVLIEINPRPGATLDIFDSESAPLIEAHLCAVGGEPFSLPRHADSLASLIAYTDRPLGRFPEVDWPAWTADRQSEGTRLEEGDPVCTVFGQGADALAARQRAWENLRHLEPVWTREGL